MEELAHLPLEQLNSLGALLAEEWTIHPSSTLPSFVEMVMMHDAYKSGNEALSSAIEITIRGLASLRGPSSWPRALSATGSQFSVPIVALQRKLQLSIELAKNFVSQYNAELKFIIWYLLERASLQSSASATVSEALYGMKRSKLEPFSDDAAYGRPDSSGRQKLVELSGSHKTRVAIICALYPYMKRKCYELFRRYQLQRIEGDTIWKRSFVASYIPVSVILASCQLICQWRFLNGTSLFFDPSSVVFNQIVRRVARSEVDAGNQETTLPLESGTKARSLAYFMSASIAFSWLTQLRVAWVNNRREQRQSANCDATMATIPPPPPISMRVMLPNDSRCPLCLGIRTDPTASSSGHVFCGTCIRSHVQRFGSCPVTGVVCEESRLVKLYEPSAPTNANHATKIGQEKHIYKND